MRHTRVAILVGVACVLVSAAPVFAKEDARATLENPAALTRAAPGERIAIAWTLSTAPRIPIRGPLPEAGEPAPNAGGPLPQAGGPEPFGASGVYVRLRGAAAGREPVIFAARSPGRGYPPGRYVAHVVVPAGGIASLAIGLEGYQFVTGQPRVRSDVFFPIDNDPFAAKAEAAAADGRTTAGSAGGGPGPAWGVLAAVVAWVGLLFAGWRARTARHA